MATPVAPQSTDADNSAGLTRFALTAALNDWHWVGRFHVGTSHHHALTPDAGYTTASAPVLPSPSNRSCLFGGSRYTGLGSPLPYLRIAATVKHCERDHGVRTHPKVDRVRKPPRHCAAYTIAHNLITQRTPCCLFDCFFDFACELFAKAWPHVFIPIGRFLELRLCRRSKDNSQPYFARRARIDALTSSQGTTSSGNASSSAIRRSSSARCDWLSGNDVASAQMLAQISSTKANRSSTPIWSIPSVRAVVDISFSNRNFTLALRVRARISSRPNVEIQRQPKAVRWNEWLGLDLFVHLVQLQTGIEVH